VAKQAGIMAIGLGLRGFLDKILEVLALEGGRTNRHDIHAGDSLELLAGTLR
jgi:hypothetical protein